MQYRAIHLGATGAVGSALLNELLESPLCTGVTVVARRPLERATHPKLVLRIVDMHALESATATVLASMGPTDVAFSTLGVGQPRKVEREEFWRVDVELNGAFARACRAAGVRHFTLLSSVGADIRSASYYLRVKGNAEEVVTSAGFERISLFRPSLLVTRKLRYGLQDRLTQAIFPRLAPLLPSRFHQIRVEELARAMRVNAERPGSGAEVLHYAEAAPLAGIR